jgi:hypothetical protein
MRVVIWRDSVSMGDDVDAPREWKLQVAEAASIGTVVEAVLRSHYLANIAGGRATWFVEGTRPIAVVAQQWAAPRWLVDAQLPLAAVVRPDGRPHVEVRYWCQTDPERVYQCLRDGSPLPEPGR